MIADIPTQKRIPLSTVRVTVGNESVEVDLLNVTKVDRVDSNASRIIDFPGMSEKKRKLLCTILITYIIQ